MTAHTKGNYVDCETTDDALLAEKLLPAPAENKTRSTAAKKLTNALACVDSNKKVET